MSGTPADPFGEHQRARFRARVSVLGGDFRIEAAENALLELAVEAFGGLPKHNVERRPRQFTVRLVRTEHPRTWARGSTPPRPVLGAGAGLLCATVDAGNFAVIDAAMSRAVVSMSNAMLQYPYHARYELLELAVLTLATRAQSLLPLHAACIGLNGNGLLLMGASGTGKSTLTVQAFEAGMQLLSDDSAFVTCDGKNVTGVPNYLHVPNDALRFVRSRMLRRSIERSPTIERRSGARKFEVDLRKLEGPIARAPLRLVATVFLSRREAGRRPALGPIERRSLIERLRREQLYACGSPAWAAFEQRVAGIPAYELRRPEHPDVAVRVLRTLL